MSPFALFCMIAVLLALPFGALLEPLFRRLDYRGRDRLAIGYASFGILSALFIAAGFSMLLAPFALITGLIMGIPLGEIIREASA